MKLTAFTSLIDSEQLIEEQKNLVNELKESVILMAKANMHAFGCHYAFASVTQTVAVAVGMLARRGNAEGASHAAKTGA